jgi:hypothetical protein
VGGDPFGQQTTLVPISRYRTRRPQLDVDTALLEPSRVYVFTVSSTLGVPGAATGDYTTKLFPLAGTTLPSSTFKAR